jgi:hypothetical protein
MSGATKIRQVVDHEKLKAMATDWNAKYGGEAAPLDQAGAVYHPDGSGNGESAGAPPMTILAELAWIGLQKATKRQLHAVILNAMRREEEV